jgi:hypothetical protein
MGHPMGAKDYFAEAKRLRELAQASLDAAVVLEAQAVEMGRKADRGREPPRPRGQW